MSRSLNNTLFFYQRDKLVSLKQGSQQRAIFRNADMPLAERQTGDASEAGLLATDDKGSVLKVQVDDEEEEHSFSAYGHAPNLPSNLTALGFNGEICYLGSGAYSLGNGQRAYHPTLMRFFSPDYLSPFAAGGFNSYAYCNGDPINLIDPSGNTPQIIKKPIRGNIPSPAAPQKTAKYPKATTWVYRDYSTPPPASKTVYPQKNQLNVKSDNTFYRSDRDRINAQLVANEIMELDVARSETIKQISKLNAGIIEKQITHQFIPQKEKREVAQLKEQAEYIRKKISDSNDELQKLRASAFRLIT